MWRVFTNSTFLQTISDQQYLLTSKQLASKIYKTHQVCTLSIFYCSDPPVISVEGTTTPVVEYTKRNITCNTRGGNPSDQKSYYYEWMYNPTYGDSNTFNALPSGMFS